MAEMTAPTPENAYRLTEQDIKPVDVSWPLHWRAATS